MGNDDLVKGAIDEGVTRMAGRREGMGEERVVTP